MLIVSRRKGQRIVIGHDIEVVVTEISRSSVKLGIQASSQHTILRGEVHDAIEQANREAAAADIDPQALQASFARPTQAKPEATAEHEAPEPAQASPAEPSSE